MNLDLTLFANVTWNVTLPNGEIISIKKPTQKQLIMLEQKIKEVEAETDTLKQLDKLIELTQFILSNNKEDKQVTPDMLENFTTDMFYAIYFGYMEFVSTITENPNL